MLQKQEELVLASCLLCTVYTLSIYSTVVASIPIFEMVIEPKQSSGVDTVDSITSR